MSVRLLSTRRAKKYQKQHLRSCIVAIIEAITRDGRAPSVAESAVVKVSLCRWRSRRARSLAV